MTPMSRREHLDSLVNAQFHELAISNEIFHILWKRLKEVLISAQMSLNRALSEEFGLSMTLRALTIICLSLRHCFVEGGRDRGEIEEDQYDQ